MLDRGVSLNEQGKGVPALLGFRGEARLQLLVSDDLVLEIDQLVLIHGHDEHRPSRGRFILLDPGRRVRSELTAQEVLGLTENLRQWAGTQTDGFLKFLGSPKFDEQFDERKGELLFESPWLSYRVTAVDAESDAIAQQYREFCDWFARLNTRLNPGYKLALARLVINEALYHRRQVPQEVTLTVQPKRGLTLQKAVMRSQHQFVRRLVESDRDRVAQTGQFMAIFQPVEFDEYVKQPDL